MKRAPYSILFSIFLAGLGSISFNAFAAGKVIDFPPIPEGYYAFGVSCQTAISEATPDDPPLRLIRFHKKAFQEAGGGPVISRFESTGGSTYRVIARSYGNGEDDKGQPDNFNITLGEDGKTFIVENNAAQIYTHCPTNSVPKAIREDWFEF